MHNRLRTLAQGALASVVVLATAHGLAAAQATDENATLLRVFLKDNTSLVSYGEPARVGDRVVFSMPTGPLPNPPLHLVNLPSDAVDWDKTDRYALSARSAQYLKSQAEIDYAALSVDLAQTLNEVAATTDPGRRLGIVEKARRALAEWPQKHYNYRQAEVGQMVGMLDEAIADLRAASGIGRFDLSLEAHTEPRRDLEPLLPPPTLQETIEQVLTASRMVTNAAERTSLLTTALGALNAGAASLPSAWLATTRENVEARIRTELKADESYRTLTSSVITLADQRAKYGDVRGVERLIARVAQQDEALGRQRPDAVNALIAAVEARLDAARRMRLARDRWELRLPVMSQYGAAIREPFALFASLKPALEAIKSLTGSSPASLTFLQNGTGRLAALLTGMTVPEEVAAPHALMVSAVQLAAQAVTTRMEATLANDMDRAWNASSAAAGALMLGTRARADILSLLRPPHLR
jgi:hypothetical protein